jgi:hypothetical protein
MQRGAQTQPDDSAALARRRDRGTSLAEADRLGCLERHRLLVQVALDGCATRDVPVMHDVPDPAPGQSVACLEKYRRCFRTSHPCSFEPAHPEQVGGGRPPGRCCLYRQPGSASLALAQANRGASENWGSRTRTLTTNTRSSRAANYTNPHWVPTAGSSGRIGSKDRERRDRSPPRLLNRCRWTKGRHPGRRAGTRARSRLHRR